MAFESPTPGSFWAKPSLWSEHSLSLRRTREVSATVTIFQMKTLRLSPESLIQGHVASKPARSPGLRIPLSQCEPQAVCPPAHRQGSQAGAGSVLGEGRGMTREQLGFLGSRCTVHSLPDIRTPTPPCFPGRARTGRHSPAPQHPSLPRACWAHCPLWVFSHC